MDMYGRVYQMGYRAAAAKCIDGFFANLIVGASVAWGVDNLTRRIALADAPGSGLIAGSVNLDVDFAVARRSLPRPLLPSVTGA